MADIPNRDELERALAKKLAGLNRRQMGELLELWGDPPNMANVPQEFWDKAGEELAAVVVPFSEGVYLEAAQRMLESVPIGISWDLVNEGAASWARDYGGRLVKDISTTTRRRVGNAVGDFYSQGQTMGDLTGRLGTIYSPQRAEMIAVTEVTRAAAEGERAFADEVAKEGIILVEIWQTSNDDLVCDICRPRNGIEEYKGSGDAYWDRSSGPPAHPRCRCGVRHEFEKPKEGAVEVGPVLEESNAGSL